MRKLGGQLGDDQQFGDEDGWTKVLNIDMSSSSAYCPQGLTLHTSPLRVCGHPTTNRGDTYNSTNKSVWTNEGLPIGFDMHSRNIIEMSYLDGISHMQQPFMAIGFITNTHQGKNNLVCVVYLLSHGKTYRRSTDRLVLLVPADNDSGDRGEDVEVLT